MRIEPIASGANWGRTAVAKCGSTLVLLVVVMSLGLAQPVGAEEPGYASFVRTTILARVEDLQPSITFWRDVMGFSYAGDPEPRSGFASLLGWSESATTYFTSFSSKEGSTVALLLVDEEFSYPTLELPKSGTAYGGVVLVHTAKNIRDVYDRAVEHGAEIIKPYGPSRTGRSIQILLRAPTGHMVEVYELLDNNN